LIKIERPGKNLSGSEKAEVNFVMLAPRRLVEFTKDRKF